MNDQARSLPASPRRRWLMKTAVALGAAGAALGGSIFWHRGMSDGRMTEHGLEVLKGLARGILPGYLPTAPTARQAALDTHAQRMGQYLSNLPEAVRLEINALLGLLANPATRYLVTGLSQPWSQAPDEAITQALERMRMHALPTTQMAYHAVRDITCMMFFTNPDNWKLVGYPGPMEL